MNDTLVRAVQAGFDGLHCMQTLGVGESLKDGRGRGAAGSARAGWAYAHRARSAWNPPLR